MEKLTRKFYQRSALEVAPELLGKTLVHKSGEGVTAGIIVETEAYVGPEDKGAHSCGGVPTERTAVMYGEGGFAYVYLIYGMYSCFNVVANAKGDGVAQAPSPCPPFTATAPATCWTSA